MNQHHDHYAANRAAWDERAPAHAASTGYSVADLAADPAALSEVVRLDVDRLGDLHGVRGVHLQCHIGTDTVSLARLGAQMTGLDFSEASLAEARRVAAACAVDVDFVPSDVYGAVAALGGAGQFDLVYTGVGALCWLPDIARWGQVVGALLRPGGRLFVREGHPVLWSIDERHADRLEVGYPYFETPDPLVDDSDGTYVATDATFTHNRTYNWNHGLGEIVSALLGAGLAIKALEEHRHVPWEALPGQMVEDEAGMWSLREGRDRLPLSYTLEAVMPG